MLKTGSRKSIGPRNVVSKTLLHTPQRKELIVALCNTHQCLETQNTLKRPSLSSSLHLAYEWSSAQNNLA